MERNEGALEDDVDEVFGSIISVSATAYGAIILENSRTENANEQTFASSPGANECVLDRNT